MIYEANQQAWKEANHWKKQVMEIAFRVYAANKLFQMWVNVIIYGNSYTYVLVMLAY